MHALILAALLSQALPEKIPVSDHPTSWLVTVRNLDTHRNLLVVRFRAEDGDHKLQLPDSRLHCLVSVVGAESAKIGCVLGEAIALGQAFPGHEGTLQIGFAETPELNGFAFVVTPQ